jgi:cytoskeletal protein RodZ
MAVKTLADFKRPAMIAIAVLSLLAIVIWAARAGISNSYAVIVAQNEKQTGTVETNAPAPAGTDRESETEEKKESSDVKKKPLDEFQPSERIEAEQAVDFPYDI